MGVKVGGGKDQSLFDLRISDSSDKTYIPQLVGPSINSTYGDGHTFLEEGFLEKIVLLGSCITS